MRVILHIGTEKTGTTSLQRFFCDNRKRFFERGVWYPASLGDFNHVKLAICARDPDQPDDLFNAFGIDSLEKHASFVEMTKKAFVSEFDDAQKSGCSACVISSEHLHSRLPSMATVQRVKEFLGDLFQPIEVIVYLRPQIDMAISLASTACRVGMKVTRSWFERNVCASNPYYNYDHLLNLWETTFGTENVRIVPYDTTYSVINDFIADIGVTVSQFEATARENASLGVGAMALANVLSLDGGFNWRLEDLPKSEALALGPELAKQLQQQFATSNAKLVSRRTDIKLSELEPAPERHKNASNVDALEINPVLERPLRELIAYYNGELKLEKTRTRLAECERAICLGNLENARGFLHEAADYWQEASQIPSLGRQARELQALIQRMHKVVTDRTKAGGASAIPAVRS